MFRVGVTAPWFAIAMNGRIYDLLAGNTERRFLRTIRAEQLGSLRGTILEIGAGTGRSFEHYNAEARVLAYEPDPDMFARAEMRASSASAAIDVRCVDDSAMDSIERNSIDAVVFQLVLCSVRDPATTIRRAQRILHSTGTFTVLEHVRARGPFALFQDLAAPIWGYCCGHCRPNQNTRAYFEDSGLKTDLLSERRVAGISPVRDFIAGCIANSDSSCTTFAETEEPSAVDAKIIQ